jgi:hypothetical protein
MSPRSSRRRVPRTPMPPIHVAPRSVLAGSPALAPALDVPLWEAPRPRPSAVRRRLLALLAAGVVVGAAVVAFAGTRVALAGFTDPAGLTSNTFATGTWVTATTWYLHNIPTPPVGDTTAKFNLAIDGAAPTAATLSNYDTNCESRAGRSINRNTGLVSEATTCRYATWRSASLVAARTLNGTATLAVWARKTSTGGTNPTLRAFLRVFDPATSLYMDLGTANVTIATNGNVAWTQSNLAWSLPGVTVPIGRLIEVKLVATGGNRDVEVAYDTTSQPSALTLP